MRKAALILFLVLFTAATLPVTIILTAEPAWAQEQPKKRKTLLELLFGGALKKQRQQNQPAASAPAKRVDKPRSAARPASGSVTAAAAEPPKPAVEKNEDAAKVLVIGDFMAAQLASGLELLFAENAGLVVVDRSVALSGLVRDDVQNWPGTVSAMIAEEKPIAIIALVGMNDRQQIVTSGGKFAKLADDWRGIYQERVTGLARAVREAGAPMIWVGLPPVSKTGMNADYLEFNSYYRDAVELYGGSFVDVWDGYVDEEGRYLRAGPDINGQIVTLRRADGINMTSAGYEKLAFFTEKALKRMTGFGKDALVSSLVSLGLPDDFRQDEYDPAGTGKTVVVALGGPVADGGSSLEGAEGFLVATDGRQSTSFELVAKGIGVAPHDGRVDSGWGQASYALPRGETPEPVLANMRGMNLRSFLDELPPLPGDPAATDPQAPANSDSVQ